MSPKEKFGFPKELGGKDRETAGLAPSEQEGAVERAVRLFNELFERDRKAAEERREEEKKSLPIFRSIEKRVVASKDFPESDKDRITEALSDLALDIHDLPHATVTEAVAYARKYHYGKEAIKKAVIYAEELLSNGKLTPQHVISASEQGEALMVHEAAEHKKHYRESYAMDWKKDPFESDPRYEQEYDERNNKRVEEETKSGDGLIERIGKGLIAQFLELKEEEVVNWLIEYGEGLRRAYDEESHLRIGEEFVKKFFPKLHNYTELGMRTAGTNMSLREKMLTDKMRAVLNTAGPGPLPIAIMMKIDGSMDRMSGKKIKRIYFY